jgi:hypothetical protein
VTVAPGSHRDPALNALPAPSTVIGCQASDQHVALLIPEINPQQANAVIVDIQTGRPLLTSAHLPAPIANRIAGVSLVNGKIVLRTHGSNLNITSLQGASIWNSEHHAAFANQIVNFDLSDSGFSLTTRDHVTHDHGAYYQAMIEAGGIPQLHGALVPFADPLNPPQPLANAMSVFINNDRVLVHTLQNTYHIYNPDGSVPQTGADAYYTQPHQGHVIGAQLLSNRVDLQIDTDDVFTLAADGTLAPSVHTHPVAPSQIASSNYGTVIVPSAGQPMIFPWNLPGTAPAQIIAPWTVPIVATTAQISNHHVAVLSLPPELQPPAPAAPARRLHIYDHVGRGPVWDSTGASYDGHIQRIRLSDYHVVITTDGLPAADGTLVPTLLILDVIDGHLVFPNARNPDLAQPICPIGVTCGAILEN